MHVLELPVNAGKADVGHLVQCPQVLHHQFAHFAALDFRFRAAFQLVLDLADDRFELGIADGPLPAGQFESAL